MGGVEQLFVPRILLTRLTTNAALTALACQPLVLEQMDLAHCQPYDFLMDAVTMELDLHTELPILAAEGYFTMLEHDCFDMQFGPDTRAAHLVLLKKFLDGQAQLSQSLGDFALAAITNSALSDMVTEFFALRQEGDSEHVFVFSLQMQIKRGGLHFVFKYSHFLILGQK